jgi:hypothetical protein
MNNLEDNKKYNKLNINYLDVKQIKLITSDAYKQKFNWKHYIGYYRDLKIDNLEDAWNHWKKHGFNEKRFFFLNENKVNTDTNENKVNTDTNENKVNTDTNENKVNTDTNENDLKNKIKPIIKQSKKFSLSKNLNDLNNVIKNDNGNNYSIIENKLINHNIVNKNNDNEIIDDVSNFRMRLFVKNNMVYKNIYDNFGLYYYGWKEIMNQFIRNFEQNNTITQQNFFDEWIEKFLICGNKKDKMFYLKEMTNDETKTLVFINNPPFTKWNNPDYKSVIKTKMIYSDDFTNETFLNNISDYELTNTVFYYYTLSNHQKEFIYTNYPLLSKKLISINYPIQINGNENCFNFSSFCEVRQIIHIGWRLRNFKTFIDFVTPEDFSKTILIKNDFEKEWKSLSVNFNLQNIPILKELNNKDYEEIFTNSCVFIDLEDSCASNTVLECIKFNTPIIVNKHPSIVEYLGEKYPLYFRDANDLKHLCDSNTFFNKIIKANEYLVTMDKTHVSLNTFNLKLIYDLNKLNREKNQLTWFVLIDDLTNIDDRLIYLYNNFVLQDDNERLKLHIVACESNKNNEDYDNFIEKLKKYSEIVVNLNISFSVRNFDKQYNEFLNYCNEICETEYLVIIDIDDENNKIYSSTFINYLNENFNCDVAFSSYKITNNIDYTEDFIFSKEIMLFNNNYANIILSETGLVWRKNMKKIIGNFNTFKNKKFIFRDFWLRAIKNNFNIKCCSSDLLYKTLIS